MTLIRSLSTRHGATLAALAMVSASLTPSGVVLKSEPTPPPPKDRDFFADFQINDLKGSLDDITVRMKNVRAKKNWQRQELEVLKLHRRILSGHLNAIENSAEVTSEILDKADLAVEDYRLAVS